MHTAPLTTIIQDHHPLVAQGLAHYCRSLLPELERVKAHELGAAWVPLAQVCG